MSTEKITLFHSFRKTVDISVENELCFSRGNGIVKIENLKQSSMSVLQQIVVLNRALIPF